jgi:hypothetical protein
MLMNRATYSLTEAGDNVFEFSDRRVVGDKATRVTGAIDFGAGRLAYESTDYQRPPPVGVSQLIVGKRKANLLCHEQQ